MLRTILIIVVLCAGLAWFFTSEAPQRSGTLTLNPAATFPQERKADLGRAMARILPHCPGLAQWGGDLLFTDLSTAPAGDGTATRISFTVPPGSARVPAQWGPYAEGCVYEVAGEALFIRGAACQALCLGKIPDAAPRPEAGSDAAPGAQQTTLTVNLNPAPQAPAR